MLAGQILKYAYLPINTRQLVSLLTMKLIRQTSTMAWPVTMILNVDEFFNALFYRLILYHSVTDLGNNFLVYCLIFFTVLPLLPFRFNYVIQLCNIDFASCVKIAAPEPWK